MASVGSSSDFYKSILQTAKRIQSKASSLCNVTDLIKNVDASAIEILHLPEAQAVAWELIALGLDETIAKKLQAAFTSAASKFSEACQAQYRTACSKLVQLPDGSNLASTKRFQQQLQKIYTETYQKKLREWRVEIIDSVKLYARRGQSNTVSSFDKKPFDRNSVSLLEGVFEINKHPTRTQKDILSVKTGMSCRQIDVWFQNRRARSKKALKAHTNTNLCINDVSSFRTSIKCESKATSAFDRSTRQEPPYAFPTPYPPSLAVDSDPFPCRFGDFSSFSNPPWLRESSSTHRELPEADISILISGIEKMKISNTQKTVTVKRSTSPWGLYIPSKKHGHDVTSSYTTRPACAPLLSLKRRLSSALSRYSPDGATRKVVSCFKAKQKTQSVEPQTSSTCSVKAESGVTPRGLKKLSRTLNKSLNNTQRRMTTAPYLKRVNRQQVSTTVSALPCPDRTELSLNASSSDLISQTFEWTLNGSDISLPSLEHSSPRSISSGESDSPVPSILTLAEDSIFFPDTSLSSIPLLRKEKNFLDYTSSSSFLYKSLDPSSVPFSIIPNHGLPMFPSMEETLESLSTNYFLPSDLPAPVLSF